MRIVHLIPGSGNMFYCENCTRDGILPAGLRELGHESIVAPMYLPSDAIEDSTPVFYGAVGMYLRETMPFLRSAPMWASAIFDAQPLLRLAGKLSGSTDAGAMGDLTVSMLEGEEGRQRQELSRLISWIAGVKPDVVHLSNGLLIGVARQIKRELGIPVVCSLQDEHTWLDQLDEANRVQAWRIMKERASDVDLFLPVSDYYDAFMRQRIAGDGYASTVVPVGVKLDGILASPLSMNPPTIGYLSQINEAMGFDILVDAFLMLKSEERFSRSRLVATGGYTRSGSRLLHTAMKKARHAGCAGDIHIHHSFERADRLSFLSSCTVLSVPARIEEALGTFQLEAMASGVPVVMPRRGGYTEVVQKSGGGITYAPNDAESLAKALADFLDDGARLRACAKAGRSYTRRHFSLTDMVSQMAASFETVCT